MRLKSLAEAVAPFGVALNNQLRLLCQVWHKRKNYLFAGSDAVGERAAAIYSLVGTAKLHDLDPQSYLNYVLERISEHPISRIEELLPWHVAAKLAPVSDSAAPVSLSRRFPSRQE